MIGVVIKPNPIFTGRLPMVHYKYITMNTPEEFRLREATPEDIPLIMELLRELAEYEKISDQMVVTPEVLHDSLFVRKVAETLIAESEGQTAGYVMYFYNFSSFIGKPGLYLEDLYIRPEFRGRGYGKACLTWLARRAVEKNCWGMEWTVLDWNKPSIDFYEGLGAFNRDGWLIYRLKGEALQKTAGII